MRRLALLFDAGFLFTIPPLKIEGTVKGKSMPRTHRLLGVAEGPQFWDEPRYTIKDVTSTLGISRTTLIWYEKIGLVNPVHDEVNGWRRYTSTDIFRIMGIITLKNSGVVLSDIKNDASESVFSPEKIEEYIAYSERQAAYYHAQAQCLQSIRDTLAYSGQLQIIAVEEFFFYPDSSEQGYEGYEGNELLNTLVHSMPIGALGAVMESEWREPVSIRWGRTVPVCYAHLLELPGDDYERIGGCSCLVYPYVNDGMPSSDEERTLGFMRMKEYLEEQRLKPSGKLFIPRVIPFDKGVCSALCLPVVPA